jgi:ribosomal protein L7/L12
VPCWDGRETHGVPDSALHLKCRASWVHDGFVQDEPEEHRPLPAAAVAALSTGQLIEAIKQVRAAEGLGLMEAKQRVETYVERNPGLKAQLADLHAQLKRRLIKWVLIIDVVLVAVVLWYFFGR